MEFCGGAGELDDEMCCRGVGHKLNLAKGATADMWGPFYSMEIYRKKNNPIKGLLILIVFFFLANTKGTFS